MGGVGKGVWGILVVALALRLGAGALLSDALPAGTDERAYASIASSIADGDGWPGRPLVASGGPSALVPPGYPFLLAGLDFLGAGAGAERAAQAVLGTVTVALIGLIAWLVFRRREVAIAALAIAAVYPALVVISAPLITESLFLCLMLGAVAAALRQRQVGGPGWAAAAGALAGLATLTKTVGLVVALVLVLALWARPRLSRAGAAPALVALAVALVVVAPWSLRNSVEFDSVVGVSNELGFGLAGAYNDAARADPDHEWVPPGVLAEFRGVLLDRELNEVQVSRELSKRALDYAAEHPTYPPALGLDNALRLAQWHPSAPSVTDAELFGFGTGSEDESAFLIAWWASAAGFLALAGLAAFAVATGRAAPVPRFLYLLALLAVLPLLLIAAGPRFRLPADVLLIVVAAPGAVALARGARAARRVTACSPG